MREVTRGNHVNLPARNRYKNIDSINCDRLERYAAEDGYIKGFDHHLKVFIEYNDKLYPIKEFATKIGLTESLCRDRIGAMGIMPHWHGGVVRREQTIVHVDLPILLALTADRNGANAISMQPCWTCQNACGGCEWSSTGDHVPNWDAEPTNVKNCGVPVGAYDIKSCPKYTPEDLTVQGVLGRLVSTKDDFDQYRSNEPERSLWRSVLLHGIRDYANAVVSIRNSRKKAEKAEQGEPNKSKPRYTKTQAIYVGDPVIMKKDCEKFFRSEYFEDILDALGITGFSGEDFLDAVRNDPEKFVRGWFNKKKGENEEWITQN